MKGYGQFCPVAKAAEILHGRWTPLVVRELLCGSTRFNDLRRGVPLMSTALLSQRLKDLQRVGIVERRVGPNGRGSEYRLTPAGKELAPIIQLLGVWGQRWVRSQVGENDLDASLLMWDMRRTIDGAAFPPRRITVQFDYSDTPRAKRHWWLVIEDGEVDLCLIDPGHDVDLYVLTDLRTMTRVWMGDIGLRQALDSDLIELQGQRDVVRGMPKWLTRSAFAGVKRPRTRTKANQRRQG